MLDPVTNHHAPLAQRSAAAPHPAQPSAALEAVVAQLSQVILGKTQAVRLALCCLLARGHLLIEDVPGVGKTTLAQALARTLGLDLKRIQFTSDLLPSDVVGTTVFARDTGQFSFHRGPVFAQVVLADEINRATPKTQSALLEAMEEHQVSLDGQTHQLPTPFFVIATQNPSNQVGTFPLPESQLDRFLMRLQLGVPDRAAEREMLAGPDRRLLIQNLQPLLSVAELEALQAQREQVFVSEAVRDYLLDVVAATRSALGHGLSPRASLAMQRAAQAWALLAGRSLVLPEDVQAVAPQIMAHRLSGGHSGDGMAVATGILARVPVR